MIGLPNIASLVILVEPLKQPFQQIPLVSGKKDVKVFLVQTGGFWGNRIFLGIKIAELEPKLKQVPRQKLVLL